MMKAISKTENTIKVLFLSAEAAPFIKIGGLGDYSGSLPKAVKTASENKDFKVEYKVIIPLYQQIKDCFKLRNVTSFSFKYGAKKETALVWQSGEECKNNFFIQRESKAIPAQVYTADANHDGDIFAFTSLAAIEFMQFLKWKPDIVHVNDWHTAFAARYIQQLRKTKPQFSNTKILISLHNLPFMGAGAEPIINKLGLEITDEPGLPFWGRNQPLPIGLSSADKIVVVSPGYAREIQTPKFGCGLERYLKLNDKKIVGILNGIDVKSWDPGSDPVCFQYTHDDIQNKIKNKSTLLKLSKIRFDERIPLFVIVSRLEWQKGIDLILDAFDNFEGQKWQLLILGTGGQEIERACRNFEQRHSSNVRFYAKFDPDLSRRVYAGGDFFLMPSRYEPCGLSQMIALRYGTIPVAARVGGLKNSIKTGNDRGTGILFKGEDPIALIDAIKKAIALFQNEPEFRAMRVRAMNEDFSWKKSAKKYLALYKSLLQEI